MSATSVRKAALFLMSLDPSTAAELLKTAQPDTVTEIAAELASLRQGAAGAKVGLGESVKEFAHFVAGQRRLPEQRDFVGEMLQKLFGEERSKEMLRQVQQRLRVRDPFHEVRQAPVGDIARALAGESAQVASVVLGELPPKKSAELLTALTEGVREEAVRSMISGCAVSADTRLRIAEAVLGRLRAAAAAGPEQPSEAPADQESARQARWRKAALLLRSTDVSVREVLLKSLVERDKESAEGIARMMVLWEDLPYIAGRALQEALRKVESRKLALALVGADEATVAAVSRSISERAKAMLDEESSLLSSPKKEDIQEAREGVLAPLREISARGELQFEGA